MMLRRLPSKTRAWLTRVSLWITRNWRIVSAAGFAGFSDTYIDCHDIAIVVGCVAEAAGHAVTVVLSHRDDDFHVWLRIDGAKFDPKLVWLRTDPMYTKFRYGCRSGVLLSLREGVPELEQLEAGRELAQRIIREVPPP